MTLKINRVRAVVKVHVPAKFHQASVAVRELQCYQRKKTTKTIQSVATARTVIKRGCFYRTQVYKRPKGHVCEPNKLSHNVHSHRLLIFL